MTADEIRLRSGADACRLRETNLEQVPREGMCILISVLAELAAQLAELNAKLDSAPEEAKKLRKVK